MQLDDYPLRVSEALTAASCALLGVAADQAVAKAREWEFDTALLYYSEIDRVTAVEPAINAFTELDDDSTINIYISSDSLTGASPNGATPTDQVQTFTRPSSNGSYTIQPGETPLDDTFQDSRFGAHVSWQRSLGRFERRTLGASFSQEYDFTSVGASASWEWDRNNRNSTFSAGTGLEFDTIDPEGGIPTPLASLTAPGTTPPRAAASDERTVLDVLVGVTQVVDRQTLMRLNYSLNIADGYLTDPYKLISVVDATPGATVGDPVDYVFENRPDTRLKQSVYWQTNHHLSEDVIRFSYRFMLDDWGIDSHTLDFHYRLMFRGGSYLEPHVRYYAQSAADFYEHSLRNDEPLPQEASADPRLAEFDATTLGIKYALPVGRTAELCFRLERYQQNGDSSPSDAVGSQRQQDLFPDLEADIAQVSFSFVW